MTLVSTLRRGRLARRRSAVPAPTTSALDRPSLVPPLAPASEPDEKPRLSDWIGVLAMCTGLVMAIMDVQIVTSSLTQIQGGLSASSDEIAWVQTAYRHALRETPQPPLQPPGSAATVVSIATPSGYKIMGQGAYHDDLVKVVGEWKIRHRRVVNDHLMSDSQSRSTSPTPTSPR